MPEIHILDKKIRLKQPDKGFRTSLDTIMLAAACPAKGDETLLDAGCGVGAAGLCILERAKNIRLTGVDIHEEFIDLATQNALLNNCEANFICADIDHFMRHDKPIFDHVISNPPYLNAGEYITSPHEKKSIAIGHTNSGQSLEGWIKALHRLLKPQGSLTFIHRSDHTDQILKAFGHRFGAIELIPLWPKKNRPSKRIIIRARKDRKGPCVIHPGIILHKDNGDYTNEAEDILRGRKTIT